MKAILSYTEFCASLGYMLLKQKRMGTGRESEGEWGERKRKETGRKGREEGNIVVYQQANKYTNYFKR